MRLRILERCVIALLLAGLLTPAIAAVVNEDRPIDAVSILDRPVDFSFTNDWAGTYQAHRDAWSKELDALTKDPAMRERLMAARMIRLLEAMLAHFKPTPAQRLAAYEEIAAHAWKLGFTAKSMYYSNRIVDETPGDVDAALAQFTHVIREVRPDVPWESPGGPEYLQYVADRVLALNRAGLVPEEHPVVAQAWQALFKLDVTYCRPLQARRALDHIPPNPGHEVDALLRESDFASAIGDVATAKRRLEEAGRGWEVGRLPNPLAPIPDFPRQFDVETRLIQFQDLGAAARPAESLAILQADPQGKSIVIWEDLRRISVWALMDRFLASQKPGALATVRQAGLDKAQAMLAKARPAGDEAALLATYRTFPWSTPGHEALADFGELSLLKGQPGIALRSFRDVLARAADESVRRRAQVGLWLALAQDPQRRTEFEASFNNIAPDALYPWMGQQATMQVIRQRLADGLPKLTGSDATLTLGGTRPLTMHTPPVSPWSCELFLTMHDEFKRAMNVRMWAAAATSNGLVLGGPNALVCYGPDASRPLWVHTAELPAPGRRDPGTARAIPASTGLSLGDGRIYCAWGMYPPRVVPESVAAFEESSGRMLWSTAGDAAWTDIAPVGSPVFAEGRVYVVAAQSGFQTFTHLVCLDARTGATLWRRHVVSQRSPLTLSDGWPAPNECDVSLHGCNLTVRDGAVYLQTNLGVVVRCDARDGVIEWIAPYSRSCAKVALMGPRQGSAPVIVGEKVIFAPRDGLGLLALDAATGRTLWQNPTTPSQEILGLSGGKLLVLGQGLIAAVDPDDGTLLWQRPVPGVLGKPVLAGRRLYVSATKLLCLSADDGAIIEEAAQPAEGPLQDLLIKADKIYGMGIPQAHLAGTPAPQNPNSPESAPPPNLPMAATWTMRRQFPGILVPPPAAGIEGRVYISSQGLLECVQANPRGTIEWQAVLPLDLARILFTDKTVLLVGESHVTALDALTGAFRWRTAVPMAITRAELCGNQLVLAESGSWEPNSWGGWNGSLAALDIAGGKLAWHRPAAIGSHNLLSITFDGKDILLTSAMDTDSKGTFCITCRPSDGVFTAFHRLTSVQVFWHGNYNFVGIDNGLFYYFHPGERGPAYRVPLDGSRPPETLPGDFTGLIFDSQKPHLSAAGDWLMLRGNQTHVYNKKNPAGYLDRSPGLAGPILGDRLFEFSPNGLAAVDLVAKKQVFQSTASSGTQYSQAHGCPDIRSFDSGIMVTNRISGVWDNRLQKNLYMVVLELLDPATGTIKARQTLTPSLTWVPTLENDRESDAQSTWINNMLIVADTSGVYAYITAR